MDHPQGHRFGALVGMVLMMCAVLVLPVGVAWVKHSTNLIFIASAASITCVVLVAGLLWLGQQGLVPHDPQTHFSWQALVFLTVLSLPWLAMVMATPQATYFLFVLILLALWILPEGPGIAVTAGQTLITILIEGSRREATIGTVVGPLIVAFSTLAFMHVVREMRSQALAKNELIEKLQHTQAELAESQREQGRLAERSRIGRDLHDTTAQSLSSIVMRLNLARAALETGAEAGEVKTHLEAAADASRRALHEVRSVIYELASPQVEGRSLPDALTRLAERTSLPGCQVRAEIDGDVPALDMSVATTLLRIAETSVANALTHAHASEVVISLAVTDDTIELGIDDDGVGFDVDAALGRAPDSRGFGIPFVMERAQALGGNAAFVSSADDGTLVSISVPLDNARRSAERA